MTWKREQMAGISVWRDGPRTVAADKTGVMAVLGPRSAYYFATEADVLPPLALLSPEDRMVVLQAWAQHLNLRDGSPEVVAT
jgi:hypothetical protein